MTEEQRCKNCEYFVPIFQGYLWNGYYWRGKCNYPIDIILPEGVRITGRDKNEGDGQNCKCFKTKESE